MGPAPQPQLPMSPLESQLARLALPPGGSIRNTFGGVDLGNQYKLVVKINEDLAVDPGASSTVASDYFAFTLTADAGTTLDLGKLTFDWGIGSNDHDITASETFGWRAFASVDDGTRVQDKKIKRVLISLFLTF